LAAEAADVLELRAQLGFAVSLGARELVGSRRRLAQASDLIGEGGLDFLRRMTRLHGGGDLDRSAELHALVPRRAHVLRDLLLVYEVMINAARLAGREHAHQYRSSGAHTRYRSVDSVTYHRQQHRIETLRRLLLT